MTWRTCESKSKMNWFSAENAISKSIQLCKRWILKFDSDSQSNHHAILATKPSRRVDNFCDKMCTKMCTNPES